MKICSRCHIEKDNSGFWKSNHDSTGLGSYCKQCCKEYSTKYRRSKGIQPIKRKEVYVLPDFKVCTHCKIEKIKESFRIRQEKGRGYDFPYLNSTCKECDALLARDRHNEKREDPEYKNKNRDRANRWRKDNPEKERENTKKFRESHKEYRIEYNKKNKERIAELSKERNRIYIRKNIAEVTNQYAIVNLSHPRYGIKRETIKQYPELIELYKAHVKLKRSIKIKRI